MELEWRSICRAAGIELEGDAAIVRLEHSRKHRVHVRETDEMIELHAIVARRAAVRDVPDLALRIWRHNRRAQLVSFRLDKQGRVYAQGWIAKAGWTKEELLLVLHRVAAESDRLELLLTGTDAE